MTKNNLASYVLFQELDEIANAYTEDADLDQDQSFQGDY